MEFLRTHTGSKEVITLEHAYHGHTLELIDISPYKYNKPGGDGKPDRLDGPQIAMAWIVRHKMK